MWILVQGCQDSTGETLKCSNPKTGRKETRHFSHLLCWLPRLLSPEFWGISPKSLLSILSEVLSSVYILGHLHLETPGLRYV